jgi:hypothetical protein
LGLSFDPTLHVTKKPEKKNNLVFFYLDLNSLRWQHLLIGTKKEGKMQNSLHAIAKVAQEMNLSGDPEGIAAHYCIEAAKSVPYRPGHRPLDAHLDALAQAGAVFDTHKTLTMAYQILEQRLKNAGGK